MTPPLPRYKIVYHFQVVNHLRAIDKTYHSGIRREIEEQLSFEPNKKTRNRKPLSKLVLNSEWESSLYWGGGVFKMTMRIASLADVKARFSEFVNFCVSQKELVVVTKHGKPAVVMMSVNEDELERLMLYRSPRFRHLAESAEEEYRAGNSIPAEEFWKQVDEDNQ